MYQYFLNSRPRNQFILSNPFGTYFELNFCCYFTLFSISFLQILSLHFWNFLQVFCKSILITESISSRTKKWRGEIGQDFNTPFFKNIDLIDFKRFFIQKLEKIKTQKKPIISDRLAPPPGLEPGTP